MINMLDPKREYLFNNGNTTAVRIATAFSEDKEKILQAFGLLYSLPGAPVCYYGDEIGMKNTPARPDVIDTRFFVRGEFDWADAVNQMNDSNSLFAQIAKIITRKT